MNDELLASIEREVLGWPGVSKQTHRGGPGQGGFRVPPATVYKFGRRQIGHIHDTGVADLMFPREIHDELISERCAGVDLAWRLSTPATSLLPLPKAAPHLPTAPATSDSSSTTGRPYAGSWPRRAPRDTAG